MERIQEHWTSFSIEHECVITTHSSIFHSKQQTNIFTRGRNVLVLYYTISMYPVQKMFEKMEKKFNLECLPVPEKDFMANDRVAMAAQMGQNDYIRSAVDGRALDFNYPVGYWIPSWSFWIPFRSLERSCHSKQLLCVQVVVICWWNKLCFNKLFVVNIWNQTSNCGSGRIER